MYTIPDINRADIDFYGQIVTCRLKTHFAGLMPGAWCTNSEDEILSFDDGRRWYEIQ